MKLYYVELYNKSLELNLKQKKDDITSILDYLGNIDKTQKDVKYAKLVSINQHFMMVETIETAYSLYPNNDEIVAFKLILEFG